MAKKKKQPAMARKCWSCGPGKRGAKFCHRCGERLGSSYGEHLEHLGHRFTAAKAVADPLTTTTYWGARAERETDPGQRELMKKMAGSEARGYAAGDAPANVAYVAKSYFVPPAWYGGAA